MSEKKTVNEKLWRYIFSIFGHIDDFRQARESGDCCMGSLTVSQARMLRVLYGLIEERPDGVALKDLAARLKISPASASEMVDVLVRKGVLCRAPGVGDRRAIAINFSGEFADNGRRVEDIFSAGMAELCEGLTPDELGVLTSLLERLHRRAMTASENR